MRRCHRLGRSDLSPRADLEMGAAGLFGGFFLQTVVQVRKPGGDRTLVRRGRPCTHRISLVGGKGY